MGFTYDPASQVQQILHKLGANGPTINQAAYTYNGVGNRESLTDRRGIQNFGYDTLDRLTSASHPLLGTAQAFSYDPVGNRTTAGNVTNAGNQLTADATHAYQYDDNGNLTRKTLLATGNYTQYTYDAENRLTKVEDFVAGNSTASFTSTYRYDGLGRRIEKVANGQTKRYIYDGEDILLEYDGSNVLQARYTHGPGIDEPIAVTKGGSTFFYHQDGLGTVTDLTDSTGATAKSYAYDAYGNMLESPGMLEQPYTYTGREFDAESGLYYYRARYYDASTGRFLQKDPIGFNGGDLNVYSYVSNAPLIFADPYGLRLELGNFVLNNPLVRSNLTILNENIVNSGIPDDCFTLKVTGGDRYRDPKNPNIHRSATDNTIVRGSDKNSPHLIERGARAVDLVVEKSGGPCCPEVTNKIFDSALSNTAFSSSNTARNYPNDPHTHIALPPGRKFWYIPNP